VKLLAITRDDHNVEDGPAGTEAAAASGGACPNTSTNGFKLPSGLCVPPEFASSMIPNITSYSFIYSFNMIHDTMSQMDEVRLP
jgi:hypothetical protein